MQKTCPNGHLYDTNIYGDQCPLCPANVSAPHSHSNGPETQLGGMASNFANGGMHTQVAQPKGGNPMGGSRSQKDNSGPTQFRPQDVEPRGGGHTVIRQVGPKRPGMPASTRKLVGFLVTYNREPNGRSYNIYEGRNYIGRNPDCDICVPDDDQMSGRHMSILYRNVDNKFKFRDEQSSNGTFINKELLDDGTLENNDIIRAGNTLFIFMAIPQVF